MAKGTAETTQLTDTYNDLLHDFAQAEDTFDATKIGVANQMAEAIVANDGLTIHIEQFALAMHGTARYFSKDRRNGWHPSQSEEHINHSESFALYDAVEESAAVASGRVMMHYRGRRFALPPTNLRYANGNPTEPGSRGIHQPLRFLVQKDIRSGDSPNIYSGYVVMPVLEVEPAKNDLPSPSSITLASFRRYSNSLTPKQINLYGSGKDFREDWHVGKGSIVAASIEDYSTSLEQDSAFLAKLADATKVLFDRDKSATENEWQQVWRHDFRDYSSD